MLALKPSADLASVAAAPAIIVAPAAAPPRFVSLDAALPQGSMVRRERPHPVYAEGDSAQRWYRLQSGVVRLCRVMPNGRRHVSAFVFPGEVFGIEPGDFHTHSAEPITPVSAVAYACDAIERRMAQDPAARHAIHALLTEHLAAAQHRMMILGCLNAGERLAAFLLDMARRAAPASAIELPMSRIDIADYLGLTIETVSRLFTALRSKGIIRLSRVNCFEILDRPALEAAAGGRVEFAPGAEQELARCA